MSRRYLDIPTSRLWGGAHATKWKGFAIAWNRYIGDEDKELKKWNPRRIGEDKDGVWGIEDIPDICGVYVFLNKENYVLYVGCSKGWLFSEIKSRYRRFQNYEKNYVKLFAAHQAISARLAENMESDLLRYYTPPWNTKFSKSK
jgi:hypothetical protein